MLLIIHAFNLICARMKRVLAFISLLLYLGYITGMVLNTCYLENENERTGYTTCFSNPNIAGEITNERSGSEFPASILLKIHTHTVATAKIKPPSSSSGPAFTTVYPSILVKPVYSNLLSEPGLKFSYVTPIFLRNCVLRI